MSNWGMSPSNNTNIDLIFLYFRKSAANVDGITKSLIKFAKGEQFEYAYESLSKNTFYFKYLCLPNSSGTIIVHE